MLLTRLPLMSPKELIARLACIKRAASVHPEPRSNSPLVPVHLPMNSCAVSALARGEPALRCTYHSSVVKVLRQQSRCFRSDFGNLNHLAQSCCLSITLLTLRTFECNTPSLFCQAHRVTSPVLPRRVSLPTARRFYHTPFFCQEALARHVEPYYSRPGLSGNGEDGTLLGTMAF